MLMTVVTRERILLEGALKYGVRILLEKVKQ